MGGGGGGRTLKGKQKNHEQNYKINIPSASSIKEGNLISPEQFLRIYSVMQQLKLFHKIKKKKKYNVF